MLSVGSKVVVEVENLSSSGLGVGYVVDDTKRAVFVVQGVPGDKVLVEIVLQRKVYFEAVILEFIERSIHRRDPVCSHFGVCGACDFLHISYDEQLRQKRKILEFQAFKHDLILEDLEVLGAVEEYHYRDKVRSVSGGFFKRSSKEVVKIKKCFIINDSFNKVAFKDSGVFVFDYKKREVTQKKAYYYYEDLEIKHHPNGFVQSNLKMNVSLISAVLSLVKGESVLELYAGNGNFTLPLVKKGFKVISVEGDKLSYELMQENLDRNNLSCESYNLDVNKHTYDKEFDTVLIDPPRTGSGDLLGDINSKNVIYVSCNSNQALKEIKRFGYSIKKSFLIDMFPNTRHFEAVFLITKP